LDFSGLRPKALVVLTVDLTQDNCTGGCVQNNVTPYGMVTASQQNAGDWPFRAI
jgi:hypothetical protein